MAVSVISTSEFGLFQKYFLYTKIDSTMVGE